MSASAIITKIFGDTKKAKVIESLLKKRFSDDELSSQLYNLYGRWLSHKDSSLIEKEIKDSISEWESSSWDDERNTLQSQDDFITNPVEVSEGAVTCGKCGSKKTFSKQLQVRSADEGFSTFCICINCNAKWRIN